jgi:TolB protein
VIYTINATGGGRVQLTDNTTNEENPAYSPDGKKITYSGQDGPKGDFEIYTIKDGGGGRFNVTDNTRGDYDPSWGDRHDDDHNDDDHNDDDK